MDYYMEEKKALVFMAGDPQKFSRSHVLPCILMTELSQEWLLLQTCGPLVTKNKGAWLSQPMICDSWTLRSIIIIMRCLMTHRPPATGGPHADRLLPPPAAAPLLRLGGAGAPRAPPSAAAAAAAAAVPGGAAAAAQEVRRGRGRGGIRVALRRALRAGEARPWLLQGSQSPATPID